MYLTRQKMSKKLPIPRKGNKYVVRTASDLDNAVSVVVALRDMLKLAKTTKEVKQMIFAKLLKLNGKPVMDHKTGIKLFNILHADKDYVLKIKDTGKFYFEETKDKDFRLCKVINKTALSKKMYQLNFHDGSNLQTSDDVKVGDTLYVSFDNKVKKHISLDKGAKVFVESGRYTGMEGKVSNVEGKKIKVDFDSASAVLDERKVFAL